MTQIGSSTCPSFAGLRLSAATLVEITGHLAAARPNEGVGLIAAVAEGEYLRAVAFYPGTNVDQSPTRYTMDPAEVLAAFRAMGANGWQLGAIVHSHVASAPIPSITDLREAYYPDALLLIVGFDGEEAAARLWRTMPVGSSSGPIEALLLVDGDVAQGGDATPDVQAPPGAARETSRHVVADVCR